QTNRSGQVRVATVHHALLRIAHHVQHPVQKQGRPVPNQRSGQTDRLRNTRSYRLRLGGTRPSGALANEMLLRRRTSAPSESLNHRLRRSRSTLRDQSFYHGDRTYHRGKPKIACNVVASVSSVFSVVI